MSKRRGKRILHTELGRSVTAAGHDAPYDIQAKRLIGIKDILGHIMADAIPICRDMDPEEAAACIESEVYIGTVPVDPGLTNAVIAEQSKGGRVEHAGNRRWKNRSGKRIIGLNTENAEINEGAVRHDILFYARLHGEMSRIMINIEIQKEMPTAYPILNRALYYACRMVSAQNERDFTDGHYGDIQRVYTIWLCMNERVNSLTHYHLQADHLMGMRKWPGNSDIINMIMIGISRELPEQNEQNRLHRLLNTLLSETMPREQRFDIISNEYGLPLSEEVEKGVNDMCNLAEGLVEHTIERVTIRYIMNMHRMGIDLQTIADAVELPADEVRTVIGQNAAEEPATPAAK